MVVTVEYSILPMWRSVGPTGQGPACSSGGGARGGPGPLEGEVRDSSCVCCASLLEGHVASPDPFLSRRWVRRHTRDDVESRRPELAG